MDKFSKELEFVKALVTEAATFACTHSSRVTPQEKANRSYVTDLDRDLEGLIRVRLGREFPQDVLSGEEFPTTGNSGPRRWSIDPIDGTGNLVHRLPLWAISIGLIECGEPVLGVIAVPPLGELYWAVKGGGAWRDGERLLARDAEHFHDQDNVCLGTNAMRAVDPRSVPGRLRNLGSACCEAVFTAAGRLSACAYLGEQVHDIAAGAVIAFEAGCRFGTIGGRELTQAEFVAETPVRVPTFVAPPHRLAALMSQVRPIV
jgi:myo-inositol-1(or 4)-monophosphatase